jgi:hypothetical protein
VEFVGGILAEAFIKAIERCRHHSVDGAETVWRCFQRLAKAPPGLVLVAQDGAKYTGLVVVERSRAVMLVAFRHQWDSPSPRNEGMSWEAHGRQPNLFEEEPAFDQPNSMYRR